MADRQFYDAKSNTCGERDIAFKFFVDGSNPPTLAPSPLNVGITSVTRVSQGIYQLTLADAYRYHVSTAAELNCNTAQARWAQSGPVANFGQALSAGAPTVQILILDNSSTVQDPPAANANNFIAGTITCGDVASI